MKYYLVTLVLLFFFSCKKEEGLTKSTGNLEITTSDRNVYELGQYYIYTEAQWENLKVGVYEFPVLMGNPVESSIVLRGLEEGKYVLKSKIFFYDYSCVNPFTIKRRKITKVTVGP